MRTCDAVMLFGEETMEVGVVGEMEIDRQWMVDDRRGFEFAGAVTEKLVAQDMETENC